MNTNFFNLKYLTFLPFQISKVAQRAETNGASSTFTNGNLKTVEKDNGYSSPYSNGHSKKEEEPKKTYTNGYSRYYTLSPLQKSRYM